MSYLILIMPISLMIGLSILFIKLLKVKNQELCNPYPKHENADKRFIDIKKRKTHNFII